MMGLMVLKFMQPDRHDTVWSLWVKAYKLQHTTMIDIVGKHSPWWKALLKVRDVLLTKLPGFPTLFAGIVDSKVVQIMYDVFVPKKPVVS